MRILFVSDFNLEQNSGGAQVSNDLIIKKGLELGFSLTIAMRKASWNLRISSAF
jgi:hypothetical protein